MPTLFAVHVLSLIGIPWCPAVSLSSLLPLAVIHLMSPPPATQPANIGVEWVDAATGRRLFTSSDLIRFDWDRQIMELRREKAMDLMSRPPRLRAEFIVRDSGGEFYRGCFMSPASSASFDGPTILDGLPIPVSIRPPLYQISGGYPGVIGEGGRRRFSPRLKEALDRAGALKPIDTPEQVAPIEMKFSGWSARGDSFRAGLCVFPETLRTGARVRIAVRLHTSSAEAARTSDFDATLNAYASKALDKPPLWSHRFRIGPAAIESSPDSPFLSLRHSFILPITTVSPDAASKPYPAELVLTLTDRAEGLNASKPRAVVATPPVLVEVLPALPDTSTSQTRPAR